MILTYFHIWSYNVYSFLNLINFSFSGESSDVQPTGFHKNMTIKVNFMLGLVLCVQQFDEYSLLMFVLCRHCQTSVEISLMQDRLVCKTKKRENKIERTNLKLHHQTLPENHRLHHLRPKGAWNDHKQEEHSPIRKFKFVLPTLKLLLETIFDRLKNIL